MGVAINITCGNLSKYIAARQPRFDCASQNVIGEWLFWGRIAMISKKSIHACIRISASVAISAWCSGCASYLSTPTDKDDLGGVVYYMPRQAFEVQVKVDGNGVQTPSIVQGDIIPDLRNRFVLSYDSIPIGENATKISVSENGLLTSVGSTVTSGVDAILKGAATLAGNITVMTGFVGAGPNETPQPCENNQTYTLLIYPEDITAQTPPQKMCDFTISVDKRLAELTQSPSSLQSKQENTGRSGVFYKTELPYLVTIIDKSGHSTQGLAYSPDESGINFVALERTFFAKNTTQITLKNGMLNEYDQDDSGELVGLASIPADVLSAYFTAVGQAFTNFQTVNTDRNALAVSEAKRQLCLAAIKANPVTGTDTQQGTAYKNIQAACAN